MNTLLIFLGAGLGGVCRFWTTIGISWVLGRQFPYGTIFVNASGCFLMGLLCVLLLTKMDGIGQHLRSLLLIGFLGGYTTFSSFSIETLLLFENGQWGYASLNIVLSVFICILLTWVGYSWGK